MERDGFYRRFQEVQRRLDDWRDAHRRLDEGGFNRDLENEIRTRSFKLKRILAVETSRFFRVMQRFTEELAEDATGDGVKCLNADAEIGFDRIEGDRLLAGRTVLDGLETLGGLSTEVVAYLHIPDVESQENDRADR